MIKQSLWMLASVALLTGFASAAQANMSNQGFCWKNVKASGTTPQAVGDLEGDTTYQCTCEGDEYQILGLNPAVLKEVTPGKTDYETFTVDPSANCNDVCKNSLQSCPQ